MNLRVIHLIRKVERIDRDLEELDSLLGTLQMDREYSLRLRDSLIEESFRLKQFRQKITSQIIRIPEHFEQFVEKTIPGAKGRAEVRPREKKASEEKPQGERSRAERIPEPAPRETPTPIQAGTVPLPAGPEQTAPAATTGAEKPNGQELLPAERAGRRGDRKKPPFLFRFE